MLANWACKRLGGFDVFWELILSSFFLILETAFDGKQTYKRSS